MSQVQGNTIKYTRKLSNSLRVATRYCWILCITLHLSTLHPPRLHECRSWRCTVCKGDLSLAIRRDLISILQEQAKFHFCLLTKATKLESNIISSPEESWTAQVWKGKCTLAVCSLPGSNPHSNSLLIQSFCLCSVLTFLFNIRKKYLCVTFVALANRIILRNGF